MKIVCENCGAKYSIADEKIKGKIFKIRCKKCNESIVIRGDAQADAGGRDEPAVSMPPQMQASDVGAETGGEDGDVETRVFDYSGYQQSGGGPSADGEAVWHIVVEGNQQGPYTTAQIKEYLAGGNLDYEQFIWREGFDDWKPIRDVTDFKAGGARPKAAPAVAAAAAPIPQAPASGGGLFDAPSGGGLFDAPASEPKAAGRAGGGLFDSKSGGGLFGGGAAAASPGDVFSSTASSAAAAGGGGLFGGATSGGGGGLFDGSDNGGDLFGESTEGEGGGIFASTAAAPTAAASPRVSAKQSMMTGQRNENSVLFSLSNLQALASTNEAVVSKGESGGGGFALGGEGSGLIDIRSMASSMGSGDKSGLDDLISIGGGGFAPSLGAPVLAAQHVGMSMGAKIAIAGGAFVVLAAVVVAAFLLLREDKPAVDPELEALKAQLAALQAKGASAQDMAALQNKISKAELEPAAAKSGTEPVAPVAGTEKVAEDTAAKKTGDAKREGKKTGSGGGAKESSSSEKSGSGKEKDEASSGAASSGAASGSAGSGKKVDELDDLLGSGGGGSKKPKTDDGAASSKPAAGGSGSGGGGGGGGASVPDKLSREQVQSGMNGVAPAVKKCGQGQTGTVTVQLMIAPTGRVTSATTTGSFAGTPAGLCAARAARGARFPQAKNSLTVTYPFKF